MTLYITKRSVGELLAFIREANVVSLFQWADGQLVATPECKPGKCTEQRDYKIYWAWDRRLGAPVHYHAH